MGRGQCIIHGWIIDPEQWFLVSSSRDWHLVLYYFIDADANSSVSSTEPRRHGVRETNYRSSPRSWLITRINLPGPGDNDNNRERVLTDIDIQIGKQTPSRLNDDTPRTTTVDSKNEIKISRIESRLEFKRLAEGKDEDFSFFVIALGIVRETHYLGMY